MTDTANAEAGQTDNEAGLNADPTEAGAEVLNDPDAPGEQKPVEGADDPGGAAPAEEPVKFDDKQQEVFDNAMHGKTKLLRDQERVNAQLQQDLTDAKSKIPQVERPEVPAMPTDKFDENFDAQMAAHQKGLQDQATFDANEKAASEQALANQQAQQQQNQQVIAKAVAEFEDKGVKLGIDTPQLKAAEQALIEAGLSLQVQAHLMEQPTGAQITVYLSKNPLLADQLARMSPMAAAVEISGKIATDTAAFFAPPNHPGDPAENLNGSGNPAGQRGPKGATYE